MQVSNSSGVAKVGMSPAQVGEVVGVGLASGAAVFAAVRRWMTPPSEKKIDKVIEGLGAGNGGPTIVSLVLSTAERVNSIGSHLEAFHEEFRKHDGLEHENRKANAKEHQAIQSRLSGVEKAARNRQPIVKSKRSRAK